MLFGRGQQSTYDWVWFETSTRLILHPPITFSSSIECYRARAVQLWKMNSETIVNRTYTYLGVVIRNISQVSSEMSYYITLGKYYSLLFSRTCLKSIAQFKPL